ncbi:Xanthine phosphoribosyltransferase [Austwickia sp. TVS 96-490-7B]|uniref:phosphoribosyltransferase n=1 Tax=Austwickia sp. TVS 96-490-7B TaxID=2830843 RepID=UPI001C592BE7|nr:phosphoribosyltransferase [Austwickia sp. TVS 96-490-7B]MBW3086984.1 Xanthine phosphoribosyltransferase [Austwickia sp. TVS 96-490-7B]
MSDEREVLTWDTFGAASRELAHSIVDSGFEPDLVLSITRGGLLPTGAISYALDIKALHIINVEFYTGVDARLNEPVFLPPLPAPGDLSGQRVLIVDDVADTGRTLKQVHDFCAPHVAETRVAVLYEKPHSLIKADYVWRRTSQWITFPWSAQPPIVRRSDNDR